MQLEYFEKKAVRSKQNINNTQENFSYHSQVLIDEWNRRSTVAGSLRNFSDTYEKSSVQVERRKTILHRSHTTTRTLNLRLALRMVGERAM